MISEEEKQYRREKIEWGIANAELEGLKCPPEYREAGERYINGDLTFEEFEEEMMSLAKKWAKELEENETPNAETLKAIEEAKRISKDPNVPSYKTMEELKKALDAEGGNDKND